MVWSALPAAAKGVPPLAVSTTRAGLPYAPQRVEAARTDQRLWLRKLRMCLELRRQPWHGGAGLLGPTGDRREPHQSWSLSATERGAVASPTGARTARRRRPRPELPRREGVLLAKVEGEIYVPVCAPRRPRRCLSIDSGLVQAGFAPIWPRSCVVPIVLLEGWYPANTDRFLSRTRALGACGGIGTRR